LSKSNGLWELKVDHFRTRFYLTRDAAMKTVTRYRRATQTIYDREEAAEATGFQPVGRVFPVKVRPDRPSVPLLVTIVTKTACTGLKR
jgi:hypothetical protein